MTTTTNFNAEPYFDDYDEKKNFHRIIFRPRMPVQARELTQLQTILQNQIERFGSHVFKDGSVVEGCAPKTIPALNYVRTADLFDVNYNKFFTDIQSDMLLVGNTSGLRAIAVVIKEGRLSQYPDTNRLYVKYLNSGSSGETVFTSGEHINLYNSSQNKFGTLDANNKIDSIQVLTSNGTVNAIGIGYGISISDGMIYQQGFFQRVESQIAVVRDYDQDTRNMVVGFRTQENIITEDTDPSLNDNALGYPNYNAPGAHRLKLTPTLIARDRTAISNNETFFTVYEFSNVTGELVQIKNDPTYEALGSVMSNRTYEDSGDYVLKPFLVETTPSSNSQTFNYIVDSGAAYVKGSRVEFFSSKKIEVDRAITQLEATQQIITTNYGNYIYANEFIGTFKQNAVVTLYDTAQLSLTNRRFITAPLGNAIGTAQIRTVAYASGTKGTSAAQYYVYLYNIQMNSTKSFSDVKSLYYSSGSDNGIADTILQGGKLVLQEASANRLVFPLSKSAIKNLRSSNGTINRTQFVTRYYANATLQANGYLQVTMGAPWAGGIDSINNSTGTLLDPSEGIYDVTLTSNTYTANLTGTISVSTGTNVVTGTGTSFNTIYNPGDYIRIVGSTVEVRRITSISNATSLVVDAVPSASNTSANHAKFYPQGHNVSLTNTLLPTGTRNINVTSSTTFEVNTGLALPGTLSGTQNTVVSFDVIRTQATAKKKDVYKNIYVKLHANTMTNGILNLGLTDVYSINGIWAGSSFANTNTDVTNRFILDNGQRDDFYDHAKLLLNPKFNNSFTNEQILVSLNRFKANTSGGIGFFSVDSYPIDDVNTANTNAIQTSQIPVYKSPTGNIVDLRNAIDFRFFRADGATNATTVGAATLNPLPDSPFENAIYIPEPDMNFQTDITYYIGRIDLLNISPTGQLSVVKGIPSEYPRKPLIEKDSMTLAVASVPPYPSLTVRENETANRKDLLIKTTASFNRNYTKKDIGTLDKRVERLEYYVTLNQLEQQAKDLQITDSNGLNRFKNGIFADPMNSHAFGDTTNFEYRIAIDSSKGLGRPLFKTQQIDLAYNASNSSNVQKYEDIITLPYTEELIAYQPFASKYRNCTEDFWTWNGTLELYPQYDMGRDETSLPNVDASIDLTQPFLDFANTVGAATGATIFGTRYGDWRSSSQLTSSSTSTDVSTVDISNWSQTGTRTTTSTTVTNNYLNTSVRTGSNTFIVPMTNNVDLGKYVTDISVQPYMRSREIAFISRGLKPNTRMYIYFDNVAVSQYCAPGTITAAGNKEDSIVSRNGAWGSALYTDSLGTLSGKFLLPSGTFRIGDRVLLITEVDNLAQGSSTALTKATAVFTAQNISTSTRSVSLSVNSPRIQSSPVSQTVQTTSSTSSTSTAITENVTFNQPEPWFGGGGETWFGEGGNSSGGGDPLGQTYTISPKNIASGVYATSLKLYFKSKDTSHGVTVFICSTLAGFPDRTNIIASTHLPSSSVNVSDDGSVATVFNFKPTYHSGSSEYAFYVMPDANSPEYRLWMAELGTEDILTGAKIHSSPYSGAAMKSSNASTWNAIPKEQIKFELYVANFTSATGTVIIENDNDDFVTYTNLSLANSAISIRTGDELYVVDSANNISNISYKGIIQNIDTTNAFLKIDSSTGYFTPGSKVGVFRFPQFANTAQANSTTLIGVFNVNQNLNPAVHAIAPKVGVITPLGTKIECEYQGTSNTGVIESNWNSVVLETEKELIDFERVIMSKTNARIAGLTKTATLKLNLQTENRYLSPVVDLTRKSLIAIENISNNDSTNEHTRYGNALTKYISKPIVLDDGQDAEDLNLYLSAWRPVNTDFEVYVKFLNAEDPDVFDSKIWTKLDNQSPEVYSSSLNNTDFREYLFKVPFSAPVTNGAFRNASNFNIVEYTSASGAKYINFKTFAIKIVLKSSQKQIAPLLDNVRTIALQV